MTNRELDKAVAIQVAAERKAGSEILKLILLAKKQNLCAELGFKDLADWLIRGHKMSERSAFRKLRATKLLTSVPVVLEKMEAGALSLTSVVQAQVAIQSHEKFTGEKMSAEEKSLVVAKIEGLKGDETERALISLFPETASEVRHDRTTVITEDISRLSLNLPNETLELIKRAKDVLSHSIPSGSSAEVISYVFKDFLGRKDPLLKPTQGAGTRRSQANTNLQVIQKAQATCEFVDPVTGQVCGSTYQVQIDHIRPKALGGTDDPSNLRCLCRRHNLYMAEKNLGEKALKWLEHR